MQPMYKPNITFIPIMSGILGQKLLGYLVFICLVLWSNICGPMVFIFSSVQFWSSYPISKTFVAVLYNPGFKTSPFL